MLISLLTITLQEFAVKVFHPKYSNVVDIYEGGYFHTRGVYRSEPTSCMNNNIPYYSAISRQAMVERIMEYAGETFDLEEFIAKDVTTAGPTTKSGLDLMPVETIYDNGKQHAPVYMSPCFFRSFRCRKNRIHTLQ